MNDITINVKNYPIVLRDAAWTTRVAGYINDDGKDCVFQDRHDAASAYVETPNKFKSYYGRRMVIISIDGQRYDNIENVEDVVAYLQNAYFEEVVPNYSQLLIDALMSGYCGDEDFLLIGVPDESNFSGWVTADCSNELTEDYIQTKILRRKHCQSRGAI